MANPNECGIFIFEHHSIKNKLVGFRAEGKGVFRPYGNNYFPWPSNSIKIAPVKLLTWNNDGTWRRE